MLVLASFVVGDSGLFGKHVNIAFLDGGSKWVTKQHNANFKKILKALRENKSDEKIRKLIFKGYEETDKQQKADTLSTSTITTALPVTKAKARNKQIKTESLGKLSRTRLARLTRDAGSQAALSRTLGVSTSTVRNWGLRLRKANS